MSAHKYLLLTVVLLIPACQVFAPAKFGPTGIPLDDRYIVGGGIRCEYVAPCAGTTIWVDRANNRPFATEPLKAGQTAKLAITDLDELKQFFGDLNKINFVLYFIPAKSMPRP